MERPTFVTHHALELTADCHLQFHVTQPDEQIQAEHNTGLYEETKQGVLRRTPTAYYPTKNSQSYKYSSCLLILRMHAHTHMRARVNLQLKKIKQFHDWLVCWAHSQMIIS